jgi:hypothetical protein
MYKTQQRSQQFAIQPSDTNFLRQNWHVDGKYGINFIIAKAARNKRLEAFIQVEVTLIFAIAAFIKLPGTCNYSLPCGI